MNFRVTDIKLRDNSPDSYKQSRKRRTIVHVWPEGESILDNLNNRRSRPVKLFRKAVEDAFDTLGVDKSNVKLSWRQKAGCNCGCSPGFIVDGWDSVLHRKDVHITITGE